MSTVADPYQVDPAACRTRQRRVLALMETMRLDLLIVTRVEHVQYLAGPRFEWVFSPAAALTSDGRLALVAPYPPALHAADEVRCYPAKSQWGTLRNDQGQTSAESLLDALATRKGARRVGVEFSTFPQHLRSSVDSELVDVEPELYRLRRRKDPDEIARLRKAIAGTAAMHNRAREVVAPGVNELEVFSALQAAAVREFGEMMTGTGNDYASGERGGPPRDRQLVAGELYILDLGPAFRGYFADNTRVIAVGGRPTDEQQRAWSHILPVFEMVERSVKPGKRCNELFWEAHQWLNTAQGLVFDHHLGHGIGLFPHEAPHLNPDWDDTFQEGEVFAVEPGLYADSLRAGIRLENNYLVTATGVELLTPFPLEL